MPAVPDGHQGGERLLHKSADGDDLSALVPGAEQLGRIGDGEVRPARLQDLQRRGRVRRGDDPDVQAGPLELAVGLRGVDRGVVGVGEVVQDDRERLQVLAGARAGFRLLAARAEGDGGEHRESERGGEAAGHGPPGRVRGAQGSKRRSATAKAP
jgi:hypothetical protein